MQPIIIPAADMRPQDLAEIAAMHEPHNSPNDHVIGACPFCTRGVVPRVFSWSNESPCRSCNGDGQITTGSLRSLQMRADMGLKQLAKIGHWSRNGDFGSIRKLFRVIDITDSQDSTIPSGAD